jgi:hypothetical protein
MLPEPLPSASEAETCWRTSVPDLLVTRTAIDSASLGSLLNRSPSVNEQVYKDRAGHQLDLPRPAR